jgi:hypothetical protein
VKHSSVFGASVLKFEEATDQLILISVQLLADTGFGTFSCSTPCIAPLLGPSGGVVGINHCNESTIGRWVIQVQYPRSPREFTMCSLLV